MRIGGFYMNHVFKLFSALIYLGSVLILVAAIVGIAAGVAYEAAQAIIHNRPL